MNLNKYIKLKEEARQALKDEEEALYQALLPRVKQNAAQRASEKRRVSLWKILTPVATVVAALAITLTCVFTQRSSDDFLYRIEKIENAETTFTEMQKNVSFFDLNYIEYNIESIFISYDSVSNDKLLYRISAMIDYSTIKLVVVINERYNYEFEIKGDTVSRQLTDYTVTYSSESLRGDPTIIYKGWIKVGTETVYFDYVQTPALGDEAFFETIQQVVQLKN